jgi:hypothetical protein
VEGEQMTDFKKFNSIVQYSGVVKQVRDHCKYHNIPLPTLKFSGSCKLHGTNGGIGFSSNNEIWFQSRERILSYECDNAGFCTWGEQNKETLRDIYKTITLENDLIHDNFYIFGEWCCGSIQTGVALNQITEKKFAIFEMVFYKGSELIKIDPKIYHTKINTLLQNVFVIDSIVQPLELNIDFNTPSSVQNFLLEDSIKVGNECPVGKYFGVSGIGEGRVWSPVGIDWLPKFKAKDVRHSASKVKTVRELTEAEIASKANAEEFVEFACTENRLNQGVDKLKEMGLEIDLKSMGAYLKWVGGDILSECKDTLLASGIDRNA